MARPTRTIDVYPNPYSGIDPDGLPQGVMQTPGTHNFIGAARDLVASAETGKTRFYFTAPNAAKKEEGALGLRRVTVPFTPEIARAVLEGGLIVADKEHARMAGLAEDDFVDAETQLQNERDRAQAERVAQYGEDAKILDIPMAPTPTTEEAQAAAEKKAATDRLKVAAKSGLPPPLVGTHLAGSKDNPSLVLRKPEES